MAASGASDGSDIFKRSINLMIVSDLDNTMVDHKDPNHESLREFASLWQSTFAGDSLLVYSTGRSPTLYNQLKSQVLLLTPGNAGITHGPWVWEEYLGLVFHFIQPSFPLTPPPDMVIIGHGDHLWRVHATGQAQTAPPLPHTPFPPRLFRISSPDIVIMSVGTEITYGASMQPDRGWEEYFGPHSPFLPTLPIIAPPLSSRHYIVIMSVGTEITYGASMQPDQGWEEYFGPHSPFLPTLPIIAPPLSSRHYIVIMSVGTEITYGASMQPDQGWEEYFGPHSPFLPTLPIIAPPLSSRHYIVIMSVGTEITYGASMQPDQGWEEYLNDGWDRAAVVDVAKGFPQLRFQADSEQRPHKVSFHLEKDKAGNVVEELRGKLAQRGLKAKVIYSGGYDLDILPERAGKGQAMAYLLRQFTQHSGGAPKHTLACGDSGNDAELTAQVLHLFHVPPSPFCPIRLQVSNAMEELVEWHRAHHSTDHVFRATKRCAGGIIEAIKHFKFGPQ
ncbi:unnamed protein product [Closterium sp. Naga37s-1]|nr:unnamed protein product [Closterium sp. Naga37s-1]